MTAIVRSLRPRSFVPRVGFHTAAVSLVRDPVASAGMRSPGVPSTNQAGSAAGQSATGTASAAAAGQGRERTDAGPSAVSGSRSHRSGDRSTALSAADSGERERQERGGGGLLPFGQQFPSLTSLLPSPLRSLFSRGGRDRDVFGDMFRDPFFSPLLPLSPVLPLTTGTTAAAPVVSRGVWDVDAELANPIQGVELDETDDAYAMKTKLSPAINKKDVHLCTELTPDGKPVLHMWGEIRRREKDPRLRAERHVFSSFQRFILLPDDVDPRTVEARFDDEHTMRIIMYKRPEERKREEQKEIDIQGRDSGEKDEGEAADADRERRAQVAAADPTVGAERAAPHPTMA